MDETKGWTIFGCVAAISVTVAIVSMASCHSKNVQAELELINRAIEAGIDPMAAKCASGYSQTEEDACLVLAAQSALKAGSGKQEVKQHD